MCVFYVITRRPPTGNKSLCTSKMSLLFKVSSLLVHLDFYLFIYCAFCQFKSSCCNNVDCRMIKNTGVIVILHSGRP